VGLLSILRRSGIALAALTLAACGGSTPVPRTSPTTPAPVTTTSTTTTAPTTTTTTDPPPSTTVPGPWPLHSTPALYPTYLPAGSGPGRLVVDSWTAPTFGGYVQSYYGSVARGRSLPELVIAGPDTKRMFATSGRAPEHSQLGALSVAVWRIVSAEQAQAVGEGAVTGVVATVGGRTVSLIGVSLSDAELAAVLSGLRPRPNGVGWATGPLPASLVRVAEGVRSADPAYVPYRLEFSGVTFTITHDVLIPRGACVCNAESWPVRLSSVNSAPGVLLDVLWSGDTHEIEWQYSGDADVTMTFRGIGTAEALKVAAGLEIAPRSTWTSLACTKTSVGVGAVACRPQQEIPTIP
jgi:hypothetical protein